MFYGSFPLSGRTPLVPDLSPTAQLLLAVLIVVW